MVQPKNQMIVVFLLIFMTMIYNNADHASSMLTHKNVYELNFILSAGGP
jgi:hypothetical protein